MPLLWRYLLSHYLKVFILCVSAFVAILLTMRLDEIAHFATLGPHAFHVIWFTLQQIPYIIPIALPISALISSILLVQNLSQFRELTALRACGFALRDILAPVIVASLFLAALNFYIVSELATTSHFNAGRLKNQLRSVNPLFLLHNKHVIRMKGFYFDTLGPSRLGEFAQDIVFFSPEKHSSRLNLMVAKQLQATSDVFTGDEVTLLTSQPIKQHEELENLFIDNMEKTSTTIQDFSRLLEKKIWTINNDYLRLPYLLVRLDEARSKLTNMREMALNKEEIKEARHDCNRCITEIVRRLSISISLFSFTLMGLAFGITVSRNQSNRGIFFVIALGSLFLVTFFVAKSFEYALVVPILLYLLPHVIICCSSFWMLHRVAHGIE